MRKIILFLQLLVLSNVCYADILLEFAIVPRDISELVNMEEALPKGMVYYIRNDVAVTQELKEGAHYIQRNIYPLYDSSYWSVIYTHNFTDKVEIPWNKNKVDSIGSKYYSISGYPCKKAFTTYQSKKVEVYYTTYFGVDFFPYADIDGIPLQYTIEDKYFGALAYVLVNMEIKPLSDEIFDYNSIGKATTYPDDSKQRFNFKVDELKVKTVEGDKLIIPEGTQKLYVLYFWYEGCVPCTQEIPYLNRLVNLYIENEKVEFIAISKDATSGVINFTRKNPFWFKQVGFGTRYAKKLNVEGYPTALIIDGNREIVSYFEGSEGTLAFEINEELKELLSTN